jgi:hypothetical protein
MKITFADKSIAWFALFSGLAISAVAVWYSVAGLISIFAAAAVPIAIMGIVLEVSKLVATVWLKQNWFIAPRLIKTYLLIAVSILMLITSMGIFGYLSKAHLDQAVPTGDVAAKVALIDEKIKTERDNIDAARRALTQMDAQVDQMLGRSDTERGAERAVQIRRNQAKERTALQSDIARSQKTIAALNQERAPIASELRKVEAEVGPIKYIAALLYGDNPDQNVLERAVRWVIILIVVIFDPLAVVLLLSSQYSFQYFRRVKEEQDANTDAELNSVHVVGDSGGTNPVVATGDPQEVITHCPKCRTEVMDAPGIGPFCPNKECDVVDGLYGTIDPETEQFFKRLRVIAKLQDIEDDQADIEEANRLISEIPKEDGYNYEPDDGPLTEEQIKQIKDSVDEHSEMPSDIADLNEYEKPYPFPMVRPLEGQAKLDQDLINSVPVLENEETWAQRVIDEEDEEADTDARRAWKASNPHDTLKRQRSLYERGLIDKLPWETVAHFDAETEESNDLNYKQNSEQSSDSLWQKIQEKKNK